MEDTATIIAVFVIPFSLAFSLIYFLHRRITKSLE